MPAPLSPAFFALLDRTAREVLGRDDARGEDLGPRVATLSHLYNLEREDLGASAGREHAAARLRFFLPRDMQKMLPPVAELARAGALPPEKPWRVLDLGAGFGAMTLGLALAAKEHDVAELSVTAVDTYGLGLESFARLATGAEEAGLPRITLRTDNADITRSDAAKGPFDFILLGFVLNEIHRAAPDPITAREELLRTLATRLAPGGALIVLEPALREASRALHAVRDRFDAKPGFPRIFAPCVRRGPCPMLLSPRDWCHEDVDAELPEALHDTAKAAGLRFTGLTYSYLTLRNDERSLRDLEAPADTRLYRIVSAPLASKGKVEFVACGDGGAPRMARLDRHRSRANLAVDTFDRGSVVAIPAAADNATRIRVEADTVVTSLLRARDALPVRDKVPQ